jgi:hypothetical protein
MGRSSTGVRDRELECLKKEVALLKRGGAAKEEHPIG